MSRGFVAGDRNQLFLLPPSVDKWASANHMVRFIWDIVKGMSLSAFYIFLRDRGAAALRPGDDALRTDMCVLSGPTVFAQDCQGL